MGGKLIVSEPKTKAANRTIILPPAMLEVLAEYKKGIFSDLMFPSRIEPDQPIDPGYVRKRLQVILKRAGCKAVRFHDLRHPYVNHKAKNVILKSKNPNPSNSLMDWFFYNIKLRYDRVVFSV